MEEAAYTPQNRDASNDEDKVMVAQAILHRPTLRKIYLGRTESLLLLRGHFELVLHEWFHAAALLDSVESKLDYSFFLRHIPVICSAVASLVKKFSRSRDHKGKMLNPPREEEIENLCVAPPMELLEEIQGEGLMELKVIKAIDWNMNHATAWQWCTTYANKLDALTQGHITSEIQTARKNSLQKAYFRVLESPYATQQSWWCVTFPFFEDVFYRVRTAPEVSDEVVAATVDAVRELMTRFTS